MQHEKILTKPYSPTLQLIELNYCLIRHLPTNLPEHLITSHEMISSPHHQGYVIKISMLNSLKRLLNELAITIPSLPRVAFKMHKPCCKPIRNTGNLNSLVQKWNLEEAQAKDVRFYVQNGGRIIIGDDWAMGKTITALAILKHTCQEKGIVICPKILITHWIKHMVQFLDCDQGDILVNQHLFQQIQEKQKFGVFSYEMLIGNLSEENVGRYQNVLEKYKNVICDQAQIGMQNKLVKRVIKKSQSVLILCSRSEKWLTSFIPILNPKIDEKEMIQRYEDLQQVNRELESTIYKYYYIKNTRRISKPPVLIKPIILQTPPIISTDPYLFISLIPKILDYLEFLTNDKSLKCIMLVYITEYFGMELMRQIEKQSENGHFHLLKMSQETSSLSMTVESCGIILSKREDSTNYLNLLTKQSRIIFCELLDRSIQNQNSMIDFTNKLFLISEKIQFVSISGSIKKGKHYQQILFAPPLICFHSEISIQSDNHSQQNQDQGLSQSEILQQSISKSKYKNQSQSPKHSINDKSIDQKRSSKSKNNQNAKKQNKTRVVYFDVQRSGSYIAIEQQSVSKQLFCQQGMKKSEQLNIIVGQVVEQQQKIDKNDQQDQKRQPRSNYIKLQIQNKDNVVKQCRLDRVQECQRVSQKLVKPIQLEKFRVQQRRQRRQRREERAINVRIRLIENVSFLKVD